MNPTDAPHSGDNCPRFCRVCGLQLTPDWRFCTHCGGSVLPQTGVIENGEAGPPIPVSRGGVGWGVKDVALGTGFYIVQAVSILAIVYLVAEAVETDYTGIPLLVGMLLLQLTLPVTVWFFVVSRRKVRWSALGLWRKPTFKDAALGFAIFVLEILAQFIYYQVLEAVGVDTDDLAPTPFVEAGTEYLIGVAILAIAIAPFMEELFFRGFVFTGLAGRWGPVWAGLVSSLLFMGAHLEPLRFPPLFLMGLLLAWLYHRTGVLWAPMLAHLLNNALAVGVLFAGPPD